MKNGHMYSSISMVFVYKELTDQEILDNNPEVPVEYIKKDRV